jgi:hypothetical protein
MRTPRGTLGAEMMWLGCSEAEAEAEILAFDLEPPAPGATPHPGRVEPVVNELAEVAPATSAPWPDQLPSSPIPTHPAHDAAVSPAGGAAHKLWASNNVVTNYFLSQMSRQVRCRTPGCRAKTRYHCRGCSIMVGTTIRCLKHLTAVCIDCRGAHGQACRSRQVVPSCIEAGLYRKNTCRLCIARQTP